MGLDPASVTLTLTLTTVHDDTGASISEVVMDSIKHRHFE